LFANFFLFAFINYFYLRFKNLTVILKYFMEKIIKGTLIPIGGNEDKGENEYFGIDFIQEGILAHVVRESGGNDSKIVIIPTASSIPKEVGEMYLEAFGKLGCTDINILDIQSRDQAEAYEAVEMVRKARCIMFSGGDQSKIVNFIRSTTMHDLLLEKLYNETDFVLAGTSAGAMCMSEEMIAGGSSTEALIKGNVLMKTGMGFVPELIIDSHFVKRGRFGRLAEAVAIFPGLMGLGLSEDTGVIIKNGNEFRVIGSGMVILFDPSALSHNNHKILKNGVALSLSNLTTHILANGDRFKIDERKIGILPLHESHI
jgi:cyanophycinase